MAGRGLVTKIIFSFVFSLEAYRNNCYTVDFFEGKYEGEKKTSKNMNK